MYLLFIVDDREGRSVQDDGRPVSEAAAPLAGLISPSDVTILIVCTPTLSLFRSEKKVQIYWYYV